jgi:hypothetical protein
MIAKLTRQQIIDRWNELFEENPWLEGMTPERSSTTYCGVLWCCPTPVPQNWEAWDEIVDLAWMANLEEPKVLTKSLIECID